MDISILCRKNSLLPAIADTGYDGVDIPVGDFTNLLTKEYHDIITGTKKEASACGLKICQTHLPFWASHFDPIGDGSYHDYEEYMLPRIIRAIEISAEVGSRTAVLHPFFTNDRRKSIDGNMQLIEKLIPTLEATGVILSVENIYNCDLNDAFATTAEDLLQYAEYFDHPLVGICLDAGHAVILRQDPNEMLEAIKSHLTALHLHSVTFDNDLHTVPGLCGGCDWNRFVKQLNEIRYEGSFNMEVKSPYKNDDLTRSFYRFAYDVAKEIVEGRF